jgi:hypothetical protein
MRRSFLIALALALALLVLPAVAACGTASQSAAPSGADLSNPAGILKAAAEASQQLTSAAGDFEMVISLEVDPAAQTDMPQGLAGQPIKVAGTFAAAQDPQALDLAMKVSGMGQDMPFAMKMVDSKAYLGLGDQWYVIPAETMGPWGTSGGQKADAQALQDLIKETGIDPATWVNDLKLAGEESVAGTTCYHLAGSPDMSKVMADVLKLMQSEPFGKLLSGPGQQQSGLNVASLLPQGEDLKAMLDQVAAAFKELTFDAWVAKDNLLLRKVALGATLVPPAGEDQAAIKSVTLNATFNLDPQAKVKVEAPASAKPMEELQKDLMNNPGLFGPFLGGLGQQ